MSIILNPNSSPQNSEEKNSRQNTEPIVGKPENVELNNDLYSRLAPNLGHALNVLDSSVREKVQKGLIDPRTGEILLSALGSLLMGERCVIPTLIGEQQAAMILGMNAKELCKSKYLRKFQYCNVIYYLNTEIYDLLDRKEHCPRRGANNPILKNRKDRASVRARKTFTDAVIRGKAHDFTAKEKMCMSIDYHIRWFVSQGQCCAESHIKPREIYEILQSFTTGRDPILENLAFLCSKFGCENEADLAYLLEATEDEIHELLSSANLKIEDLARYWESC